MLTSDLIRIAVAGGGLRIDCAKHLVPDIIRIVTAAGRDGGLIILENTINIQTSDKIRIAAAGKGHVLFNDTV